MQKTVGGYIISIIKTVPEEELKIREKKVEELVQEFSLKPKELINGKRIEDLIDKGGINPYLVNALDLRSVDNCIEYVLIQSIGRSLVTSFGTVLEKFIAIILGGKRMGEFDRACNSRTRNKPWYCWWDVIIDQAVEEDGKEYKGILLSVKSGPADMNKDQVFQFCDYAQIAEENGYRPYEILVYGKKASGVITSNLEVRGFSPDKYLKVGKEIFEEFFDDPNYYKRALTLFSKAGLERDLFQLIDEKKTQLAKELNEMYGDGLDKLLEDTLKGED